MICEQRHVRLIIAVLSFAIVPAVVAAQQDTPEQVPPGAIVYGPLTLAPSLVIKDMGVDDNVFNEAVDPKSDFTFTLSPKASATLRVRRVRLAYTTSIDYVYYDRYDTERGTNVASEVRADVDLGRLRPFAVFDGTNTRNRLNSEVDARARHHDQAYGAGLTLRVASRTSLLLNARHGTIRYDDDADFRGVPLQESFDGSVDRIETGFGIELTPVTTYSLVVQHEQQRFDLSPSRNSETWRVSPTLTFSPTGLLTGVASFGYRHFDAVDPGVPDYSGFIASATIGATIYARHQLEAAYLRDVQYSYDLTTPYYLRNGGNLTWTTIIVGPWDVRGTGGRTLMHYRGDVSGAGTDTLTTYGGGIGFRFSEQARLGMNAEWADRSSNRSLDREYRNRRIFASLTWGIPR
jgi:hypothetical protein